MSEWDATQRLPLADAAATAALGRRLAGELQGGAGEGPALLLLRGELGAGKTCLVQGLAEALGITEPITSPTFALAQHYRGRLPGGEASALVHLDLYRLEQAASADELFAQEEEEARELGAVLAVEWPERLSFVPAGAWDLELGIPEAGNPETGIPETGRWARVTPPASRPDPAWPATPGSSPGTVRGPAGSDPADPPR